MKVLIVGDMNLGTNSRSLADGFKANGHETRCIDTSVSTAPPKGSPLWWSLRNFGHVTSSENNRVRQELSAATDAFHPDMMLAIKTVAYDQGIFLEAIIPKKLHLSFDDVSNPDNTSPNYLRRENEWDLIITTKRHNIQELCARGAQDVLFMWGAYDPQIHRNVVPLHERKYDIGFIGAARPDRAELPRQFARHAPTAGAIFGPRWRRHYPFGVRGVTVRGSAAGSSYAAAANSFRIGLVLLNSDNRDQHTMRTFETPASGQAILAERTDEHMELFEENESAIFFAGLDEAWEKLRWLLSNRALLGRIASAGHRITTEGRHTYRDRAQEILNYVSQ